MAEKHPYVTSGGPLIQVINHLRDSFPATVTAETLKKLGYAKKNESYIINTLRFIGVIDEQGNKTEVANKVFNLHEDNAFQKEFSKIVEKTYSELFALHKEKTWSLNTDNLITFFRQTDHSSAIVGKRQANTFKTLAGLSGRGELLEPRQAKTGEGKGKAKGKKGRDTSVVHKSITSKLGGEATGGNRNQFGLTVRIEINLPAEGDQETYDRIFKSIRENLLNG